MKYLPLALLLCTGCGLIRPFDVPEFAEIQHHETGYVIPLEGANKDTQVKFDSQEALDVNRVAMKRIQIPHRWVRTGRFLPALGHYIDTVRLVVVNRSPETREWTADNTSGTNGTDQAIWLESRDSISFSLGFNCTALIDEPDTTKFLYRYPTARPDTTQESYDKSVAGLAHVMDTEIRARVQMLANTIAARYDLDDLRARKSEIINAVRNGIPEVRDSEGNVIQERLVGVVEHFADRGITITNLGQFGGFEYEDPAIQQAINETFVAQQEKVRTEAAFEAQQKKNDRVELEANAQAEQARRIAQGQADARLTLAEAEAEAIRRVAAATKEAGQDPLFLQVKQLEVESQRIDKWDGAFPKTLMGESPQILMGMPQE